MESISDRSRVARSPIRSSASICWHSRCICCLLGSISPRFIGDLKFEAPMWGAVPLRCNQNATDTPSIGRSLSTRTAIRGGRERYLKDSFCFLIGHSTARAAGGVHRQQRVIHIHNKEDHRIGKTNAVLIRYLHSNDRPHGDSEARVG